MNPKKFTATTSWAKAMTELPDKYRLEVYDAIFAYAETGTAPEMSETAAAAFGFVKNDLDEAVDRLIDICDKRKEAALKRWNRTPETKQPNLPNT